MANYNDHLNQAVKNIQVLYKINNGIVNSWDWQVTVAFYSALHLANAHIAKTINGHYRTHAKVGQALNPYSPINPSSFNEEAYLSYLALQGLSRRARYLCNDKETIDGNGNQEEIVHFTSDKHLAKAIRHLNNILKHFSQIYNYSFSSNSINCPRIINDRLEYFGHNKILPVSEVK